MSEALILGYSSSANITFNGEIETCITVEEWKAMTEKEQHCVIEETVWELIDVYPKNAE